MHTGRNPLWTIGALMLTATQPTPVVYVLLHGKEYGLLKEDVTKWRGMWPTDGTPGLATGHVA